MENLDDNAEQQDRGLSNQSKTNLHEASGWAKTIAILGFIGSGFMVIAAIGMLFMLPVIGIVYIIMAGIYIYVSLLLFKQAQAASRNQFNMEEFTENYLKFWKVTVILTIIGFVLGIIGGVVGGIAGSNMPF
ncbi:MAG: hypothetical protein ACQERC_01525 [Bacteroidota bacterium]